MTAGIILDLIIIAIVVLYIFISARHGFVRTLIEVAGFIAACVVAFTVSSPLADLTYDKIIEPKIISNIEQVTSDGGNAVAEKLWNSFPDIIKKYSADIGVNEQAFYDSINSTVAGGASDSAVKISENVTKPLIIKLVSALYSTVITIVLIIVSKYLAIIVNRLFKIPVIGKINAALGGVVGAVKGLAFAFVFCAVISIIILLTKNGFWIFNPENIESSNLFKLLYGFSPFV